MRFNLPANLRSQLILSTSLKPRLSKHKHGGIELIKHRMSLYSGLERTVDFRPYFEDKSIYKILNNKYIRYLLHSGN